MRQTKSFVEMNVYDCKIQYHPGKVNVVTDARSRKQPTVLNRAGCLSFVYAMLACSDFIQGVGVGHSGKDNFDQLGVRLSI